MNNERIQGVLGIVLIGLLVWAGVAWYKSRQVDYSRPWWSGTQMQYACNNDTGSCYTLNVGSNGNGLTAIYFENGGYIEAHDSACYKSADGQGSERFCKLSTADGQSWDVILRN